jgi:hypothetical protein
VTEVTGWIIRVDSGQGRIFFLCHKVQTGRGAYPEALGFAIKVFIEREVKR